jgi:hypothetical protein
VRLGRPVSAAGGEFELGSGSGNLEENSVVSVVIGEPTELGKPDAVTVEGDELIEAIGVAGDAKLHRRRS